MTAPETTPPADAESPRAGVTSLFRCANPGCRHLDVFHDLPRGKRIRASCSMTRGGTKPVRCTCAAFTPDIPKGLSND